MYFVLQGCSNPQNLQLYMYVCVYTHIHIYIHTYIHIYDYCWFNFFHLKLDLFTFQVLPPGVAFTALKSTLSRMCSVTSVSSLAWNPSALKKRNVSLLLSSVCYPLVYLRLQQQHVVMSFIFLGFFLNIETDGWHSAALFPNDMELLGLNHSPANSQYISNCIEETSFHHVTSVIITQFVHQGALCSLPAGSSDPSCRAEHKQVIYDLLKQENAIIIIIILRCHYLSQYS